MKKNKLFWGVGSLILVIVIVGAIFLFRKQPMHPIKEDAVFTFKEDVVKLTEKGDYTLVDYVLFGDKLPAGWCGAGGSIDLDANSAMLPIDEAVKNDDKPALRLKVNAEWWKVMLAFRGWASTDMTDYIENGTLEFDIKGNKGGEVFSISFEDKVLESRELDKQTLPSKVLQSDELFIVTTDWQRVSIPFKDFLDGNFDAGSVTTLVLTQVDSMPLNVWLSDIRVTSPDLERTFPEIKVNQVGYYKDAQKIAVVSGLEGKLTVNENTGFSVVKIADNQVAFEGKLMKVSDFDYASGEEIYTADFTDLQENGKYYIKLDDQNIEQSLTFEIAEKLYDDLLVDSARYFLYQRSGIELKEEFAPDYPHPLWHGNVTQSRLESDSKKTYDASGAWYDAGEFGKYITNVACASMEMLWAYEMFPEVFKDNQFNIPESGNGIPDILDEIKIGLDFVLNMQDEATGGFYHRAVMPEQKFPDSYYVVQDKLLPTSVAADATAILAQAYTSLKEFDKEYANICLESAKRGWVYLVAHPEVVECNNDGPYTVNVDDSNRLWAAAALFRATGEEEYNVYFLDNFNQHEEILRSFVPGSSPHYWGYVTMPAFFTYLTADGSDARVKEWFSEKYKGWFEREIEIYNQNPWKNSLYLGPDKYSRFYWGSNSIAMSVSLDMIVGSKILGWYDDKVEDLALGNLNYVLGLNPLRKSFVTGYGEDSSSTMFSKWYSEDGKTGVPKGYLVGGANAVEGKGISRFDAKCYIEHSNDWGSNENCNNWNAELVFSAAFAASLASK